MYPLPKDKIMQEYKKQFGAELTPDSDFTKLPDEILANAHLYGWVDKVSIQANVEMARRLKNTIIKMDESSQKYSERLLFLTWAMAGIGLVTIGLMIWQIISSQK